MAEIKFSGARENSELPASLPRHFTPKMAKERSKKSSSSKRDKGENANLAPLGERPAKKAKLLDDSDDEADNDVGGVSLKVNEEYARRFEHNKKRAERHRCEHLHSVI